jgi:hypothetical protein
VELLGPACFEVVDFEADLLAQFLLVHWLLKIIDPQVQNSGKYITPFIYLNISHFFIFNNRFWEKIIFSANLFCIMVFGLFKLG